MMTALACFRANVTIVTVYATLGEDVSHLIVNLPIVREEDISIVTEDISFKSRYELICSVESDKKAHFFCILIERNVLRKLLDKEWSVMLLCFEGDCGCDQRNRREHFGDVG